MAMSDIVKECWPNTSHLDQLLEHVREFVSDVSDYHLVELIATGMEMENATGRIVHAIGPESAMGRTVLAQSTLFNMGILCLWNEIERRLDKEREAS